MSDDPKIVPLHPRSTSGDPFLLPAIQQAWETLVEENEQALAQTYAAQEANTDEEELTDEATGGIIPLEDPDTLTKRHAYLEHRLSFLVGDLNRAKTIPDQEKALLHMLSDALVDVELHGMDEAHYDHLIHAARTIATEYAEIVAATGASAQDPKRSIPTVIHCYLWIMENARDSLMDMVLAHQLNAGVAPADREETIYDLARKRFGQTHPNLDWNEDLTDDQENEMDHNAAEILTEIFEPYKHVLPSKFCPEMAFFIGDVVNRHSIVI